MSTSDFEDEKLAVREIYAAINRHDIPAVIAFLDPQIEWIEPIEYPRGGTRHGLEAVSELFSVSLDTWAEGSCEPERLVVAGDTILVLVHVHVRLKESTEFIDGRIGDAYRFRDGKVVMKRTFDEWDEALEWAGIEDPEAN